VKKASNSSEASVQEELVRGISIQEWEDDKEKKPGSLLDPNAPPPQPAFGGFQFMAAERDPLMSGPQGQIMRWKAGKVIGRGSFGEVMTALN
jgi:hypothetical protein